MSNKPSENSFNQQRIAGWFPVMNPRKVVVVFLCLGVIYLILGIIALAIYNSLFFFEKYYTDDDRIPINLEKDVKPPIFVHYTLAAIYQNHQNFINSVTDKNEDKELRRELIEASCFNDTFFLEAEEGVQENIIEQKNIIFEADEDRKDLVGLNENQKVWTKIAPFPTFRKLYGVINKELKAGLHIVKIENNYYPLPHLSKKALVLQTVSLGFGGRNIFAGVILLATGGGILALDLIIVILHFLLPRKLGDYHLLFGPDFADTRLAAVASGEKYYTLPSYLQTTDDAFRFSQNKDADAAAGGSTAQVGEGGVGWAGTSPAYAARQGQVSSPPSTPGAAASASSTASGAGAGTGTGTGVSAGPDTATYGGKHTLAPSKLAKAKKREGGKRSHGKKREKRRDSTDGILNGEEEKDGILDSSSSSTAPDEDE